MKISFLLIMLTVLNAYSTSIFSQNAIVSIIMQNATIREVVSEIERQGEIKFLFNDNLIGLNQRVNVSFSDQPIEDVPSETIIQTDLMYEEIKDDFVVLISKSDIDKEQVITVTGRITDAVTDEPLPGANVVITGTSIGTVTDIEGRYSLEVNIPDAVLEISYVGYTTVRIAVDDRTSIDIQLKEDLAALEEVIVVGYGN